MAEFRSDSVDELIANFSEEQFARAQDCMERRASEMAPWETTPAPSARMGMFMPTSAPELRGRKNLAIDYTCSVSQNGYVHAYVRPRVEGP